MNGAVPEEVTQEVRRAEKSLAAARALLAEGLLEDALSRAYYAVLHAARALLLAEGVAPQSHEAVRRLLGLHLVKTGKLAPDYARILREEQDDRALADYDVAFHPERERVVQRVEDAAGFLAKACEMLRSG